MSETIRIATLVDADAVIRVTRAAYAKWVPVIGREPLPMKADHAAHIRDYRTDLLLVDDEVAALVEIIPRQDDMLIENIAVAPIFQKRGYGRRMVAHAERLAADAKLKEIRLYTNARFEENIRLYRSLGYDIEQEEATGDGFLIHMVKAIELTSS